MSSSRRDFLRASGTAAAALTLAPLERVVRAEEATGAVPEVPTVKALEDRLMRAHPVPLEKVRLTSGPLKDAQDATIKYLLSLEPDRMLAYYRVHAGLPKKGEPYTGWDGGGRNLTGHIAGHHLSAISYMYQATGDKRFKDRVDYMVRELKAVQDKYPDGYLGALEGGREMFQAVSKGDIRSGGFDLNGFWSPWYTLHKTYAGLRDAYRCTGNLTALEVSKKYAGWAESILKPMSDEQVQKMLNTEHGGMNEVLADLYADTGNKRWLDLSYRFEHHNFTDPLKHHQDNLSGKHGNCNIVKMNGSSARYGYTADLADFTDSNFFFDRVAQHHSYATGGHGLAEYWGPPDVLGERAEGRTCESCNEYNMVKLGRRLFSFNPDAQYFDYNERVLFNHVLASIDPSDGKTSYMVPVGRVTQQEYQDMQRSFTCCVGTGMENHALHGYGIYYETPDNSKAWVTLYAPSVAQLKSGVKITQDTSFPEGETAKLTITSAAPKAFTLALRRPVWAGNGFQVKVNGAPVALPTAVGVRDVAGGGRAGAPGNEAAPASTFVEINRTWKTGDVVEVTLPKSLRLEPTPDMPSVAAIMWGPLVLVSDLGPRQERRGGRGGGGGDNQPVIRPAVLVGGDRPVAEWVSHNGPQPGDFVARGVARIPGETGSAKDIQLRPFYRVPMRTYGVYQDVLTQAQFASREAAIAAERDRLAKMEAATVGNVQPGQMQPERDFNYQSQPDREPGTAAGRTNRGGTGWFSFDMPVDPQKPNIVAVTYMNAQQPANGNFQILVNDTVIARFEPNTTATGFYVAEYPVPVALTQGKSKVTVKFQAAEGRGRIAPVFGVRTVRKD